MTGKEKLKIGILFGFPIITAALSFFDRIAIVFDFPYLQWDKTVYNYVMIVFFSLAFLTTECLFCEELKTGFWQAAVNHSVRGLTVLLINLSLCLLIFVKNTETWGYTFGWEHPLSDLWGWPLFWLAGAMALLFIQSPLGKQTRNGTVALFHTAKSMFRWVGDLLFKMGSIVKNSNGHTLALFFCFVFIWLFITWMRMRTLGAREVVSDNKVLLWTTIILFIGCYVGGVLLYLFPTMLGQLKKGIDNLGNPRKASGPSAAINPAAATSTKLVGGIRKKFQKEIGILVLLFDFVIVPLGCLICSALQDNAVDFSAGKSFIEYMTAFAKFLSAMADAATKLLS